MYEPKEQFDHIEPMVWNPDCIFVYNKKVYVCEVQLTRLSRKQWARKWGVYNNYFNRGYYQQASFQAWGKGRIILPQFLAITNQQQAREGFEVRGRELIVTNQMA